MKFSVVLRDSHSYKLRFELQKPQIWVAVPERNEYNKPTSGVESLSSLNNMKNGEQENNKQEKLGERLRKKYSPKHLRNYHIHGELDCEHG
ncbi:hypothetical protein AVEN_83744-1 [Araneus ventricosus]|uniref:Uncharacterized protein n=1 Tax=Araneus ventricosus TaxID=182803 RepID=A0A4Y2EVA6_ARAVE|nr:hypothetical protein AVEN_83744-1 [Araneus ventricosus]